MDAADRVLPVSVLLLVRDETADVHELLPQLAFARERVVVWDANGDPATRHPSSIRAPYFQGTSTTLRTRVIRSPF